MTLRNRLLALSLLTLLLPWFGWKLLQELEGFLRESQENALLSAARTLAGALPFESQRQLLFAPDQYMVLRKLGHPPVLDGFGDDWPYAAQGLEVSSPDGLLEVRFIAGTAASGLYVLIEVSKPVVEGKSLPALRQDHIELRLRGPRGLLRFDLHAEAPGPVQLFSEGGGGQAEGYWLDTAGGYRVELVMPAFTRDADLGFTVSNGASKVVSGSAAVPGHSGAPQAQQWITLVPEREDLSALLAGSVPDASRAWLVNQEGWVLADSGPALERIVPQTTWLQRVLYRLVAGSRTALEPAVSDRQPRLQSRVVAGAMAGEESRYWAQDPDTAIVHNVVAVPVEVEGRIRGAIVLQSFSEGLLLATNRAFGRLLITTLALTFGLAGGMWYFATRLSRRVRRLSGAVSEAMQNNVAVRVLPLTRDSDELGELARNNERLLRAVADYTFYLQTLAGKLSHELQTPLAITRSSLDNLSSRPLDPEALRFLQRAQEGVERQAAIIRAMSEANRLEASIRVAEWEETDLVQLVAKCAENYRAVFPGRRIRSETNGLALHMRCSPELLVQALDKLVDNAVTLSAATDEVVIALQRSDRHVDLSVRNSGTRLPAELQERIFDSLVSVRDKRGSTPHLGLGLYIVRLVAVAHGGSVNARNLPQDQGVEFTLRLPA